MIIVSVKKGEVILKIAVNENNIERINNNDVGAEIIFVSREKMDCLESVAQIMKLINKPAKKSTKG